MSRSKEIENRSWIHDQFRWSLQALASNAETQRSLFPDFVCKAEELALDFDHWSEVVVSACGLKFADDQAEAVRAVDRRLMAMSLGGAEFDEELWTDEALGGRPQWDELRSLAGAALASFGWPMETPPRGRSLYGAASD